jgi:ankyrin repeat protein
MNNRALTELLYWAADKEIQDANGDTAMHIAARNKFLKP